MIRSWSSSPISRQFKMNYVIAHAPVVVAAVRVLSQRCLDSLHVDIGWGSDNYGSPSRRMGDNG